MRLAFTASTFFLFIIVGYLVFFQKGLCMPSTTSYRPSAALNIQGVDDVVGLFPRTSQEIDTEVSVVIAQAQQAIDAIYASSNTFESRFESIKVVSDDLNSYKRKAHDYIDRRSNQERLDPHIGQTW